MLQAFSIGDRVIDPPLVLAPMEGQTDYALRSLVREQGACGLVYTEFLSGHAMTGNSGERRQSEKRFDWHADEQPLSVQLYGSDPARMAEAAQLVVARGASIVDINMGCWVPKIAKKGAGAALLRDVGTATAVVDAVVRAVNVPVTVKVRSGFEDGVVTAVPFAQAAADLGVKAIAVHARFAGQGHAGPADWDVIRQVKDAVPDLPVIGNGDVVDGPSAQAMFEQTGCDGVMVGRGALGRPWVFREIAHYLRTGEILPPPNRTQRAQLALEHARRMLAHSWMPERQIALELRGRLGKYRLDEPGSVALRNRLVRSQGLDDIEAILAPIIAGAPERV